MLDGFEVVHIDKSESLERIGVSSQIGSRGMLHSTGLGKTLLATRPDGFLEAYLKVASHPRYPVPVADPTALRRKIERTRERGYSVDDEEDSIGVRCVGVAVRGAGGSLLFAISLTGPSPRFTRVRIEELAPSFISAAQNLSRSFGWADGVPPGTGGGSFPDSLSRPAARALGHWRC